MNRIGFSVIILIVVLVQCSNPKKVIVNNSFKDHVRYLASEECAGRYPGEEGSRLASNYINEQLQVAELQPLLSSVYHSFKINKGTVAGEKNSLVLANYSLQLNSEFVPKSYSTESAIQGEMVYVGYGLEITNDTLAVNHYKGLDVKGKVVLMRKGAPDKLSGMAFRAQTSDVSKAIQAREKGAAAVILISEKGTELKMSEGSRNKASGIPVIEMSWSVVDSLFSIQQKDENWAIDTRKCRVQLSTDIDTLKAEARNVICYFEGADSILKNEWLILGAHYDHLGMGGKGSSSRMQDTVAIHYGADDNASGVAAIIELGEKLKQLGVRRSVAVMAFDGEEMGLLGSKAIVNDSILPWGKVTAMVNIDMIGRMKIDKTLQIGGVGTSTISDTLIKILPNPDSLLISTTSEGYGPSDHASFYGKDVPVFFISTGAHLDYHTPFDQFDSINFEGADMAFGYIFNLTKELANRDDKLKFQEAGPKTPPKSRGHGAGISLGIMPDFAGVHKQGLRADFVIKGRPAYLGGMKDGDIIVKINSMKVGNIDDYMFCLGKLKAGQTIHVEVLRNNISEVLLIQL